MSLSVPAAVDPHAGPGLAIQAIFSAPSFLFRAEFPTVPAASEAATLSAHQLLSHWTFALWGSGPTRALLERASAGELDTEEGRRAIVDELLDDPRATEGIERFSTQWLQLRRLRALERDLARYPEWDDDLRESMEEETRRFLRQVWTSSRPLTDVFTAKDTYINADLAALYRLPEGSTSGDGLEPYTFAEDAPRGGVLTHASILAATAHSADVAPILRGQFVREVFMCEPLPAPPDDVPAVPPPADAVSERERLAEHRTNPTCAACHQFLDPLGFGLEQYDLLGRWRDEDEGGFALSGEGEAVGLEPPEFRGAVELGQRLAAAPSARACIVTRWMQFAHGAAPGPEAREVAAALERELSPSASLRAMIEATLLAEASRWAVPAEEGSCE